MRKAAVYAGVFCWLLALSLSVFGVRYFVALQKRFAALEPHYCSPVPLKGGAMFIRRDAYGKGYFGAPRDGGRTHKGVDLLADVGEPVFAAKSGRVSAAEVGKGYGVYVEIFHPDGLRTRYAHLSRMYVEKGGWVRAGEIIGACGKTGNASNPRMKPHLHFEIVSPSGALNPSSGLFDPRLKLLKS